MEKSAPSQTGYQIYGEIIPDILFSIARQRGRVAYPVLFVVFGSTDTENIEKSAFSGSPWPK